MTYLLVAPAPRTAPCFYDPVPFRPAPPRLALSLSTCCYTPRIEMNRNEEGKSRNIRTIKKYLTQFSAPNVNRFSLGCLISVVSYPSQQNLVNKKERQNRCQRKHIKNTTINQILPFVIQNLGPVAGNERRQITGKERQRRGAENTRIQRNLPLFISRCFIVVVSSVSEEDREGTIDATVFRTIKISHLDLAQSGLFLPPCTNSKYKNQSGQAKKGNARLK